VNYREIYSNGRSKANKLLRAPRLPRGVFLVLQVRRCREFVIEQCERMTGKLQRQQGVGKRLSADGRNPAITCRSLLHLNLTINLHPAPTRCQKTHQSADLGVSRHNDSLTWEGG
jgi:hypothetical protein